MIICCCWIIFGVGIWSFTFGNMASIISEINERKTALRERIDNFEKYAAENGLPEDLIYRIKRHFKNNQPHKLDFLDPKMLLDFPYSK